MSRTHEVVLVSMPYHCVERPNMALGILGATLRKAGLDCRCLHPNIEFAATIGLDTYDQILSRFSGSQFAEMTFTAAAFGEDAPRYQRYLGQLIDTHAAFDGAARYEIPRLFHRVRSRASAFVDRVAKQIVAMGPRIVGCSSMFEQHVASLAVLRRVKELAPSTATMIGGPNVEGPMGQATVNNFDWVDYAVSGEADALIVPLCRELLEDGHPIPRRRLPAGVLRRALLPVTRSESPRVVLSSMDEVATPDFDDYFADLRRAPFRDRVVVGLTVETSRGCWYGEKKHCTFCGQNGMGMQFRSKSGQRVVEEFRGLSRRYRCANFGVVDNILDLSYFKSVLPQLERDPTEYRIFYELKPNMKRRQLEQLWRSGVRSVIPGFESLDDEPLALMHKGTSVAINVQVLKWAAELGIYVHWIMLHGVPGESDASYERMAELIPKLSHLQPPNIATPIEFHRFSPYLDTPQAFGLELQPHPAYDALYPVPKEQRRQLAYYFVDHSPGGWNTVTAARRKMLGLLGQWVAAHLAGARLTMRTNDDGALVFEDTRPNRVDSSIVLSPRDAELYRSLDAATPTRSVVDKALAGGCWTRAQVEACLEEFKRLGIAIEASNKWLALATAPPRPIAWLDYKAPHGVIVPRDAARRRTERRPKRNPTTKEYDPC